MTWEKDSHGLFDYEYKHTDILKFTTQESTAFARLGNCFHYSQISKDQMKNVMCDPSYLTSLEMIQIDGQEESKNH